MDKGAVFADQAYRLVKTLIHFGEVDPTQIVVHFTTGCAQETLERLAKLGVELVEISPFSAHHAHSNKIVQTQTPRLREADFAILMDCDMAVAAPIAELAKGDRIRAKIVDADPFGEAWPEIFREAGFGEPRLTGITSFKRQPTPGNYCNGGLLVIPKRLLPQLGEAWARWAEWLIEHKELLGSYSFYTDQIAFTLALEELKEDVELAPAEYNCPTHLGASVQFVTAPPKLLHYHQKIDADGYLVATGNPLIDKSIQKVNTFLGKPAPLPAASPNPPAQIAPPRKASALTACAIGVLFCSLLVAAGAGFALRFQATTVLDDGFMGFRYVHNLLQGGGISWNIQDGPVYGMTSLLFLNMDFLAHLVFPNNAVKAAMLSTTIPGLIFLFAVAKFGFSLQLQSKRAGWIAAAVLLAPIAFAFNYFAGHLLSGVDTCFTLLLLFPYLVLLRNAFAGPARRTTWIGVYGGLLYAVRPDLLVFSVGIPGLMLLIGSREQRAVSARLLIATLTVVAGELLLAQLYFGSPVPLPFYVKGLKRYGPEIYRELAKTPAQELKDFVISYWPYLILACCSFGNGGRRRIHAGIAICTLLFAGYYRFFVLQVLHADQRFYYPCLPALIILSGAGLEYLARGRGRFKIRRKHVAIAALAASAWTLAIYIPRLVEQINTPRGPFTTEEWEQNKFDQHRWFKLDELAKLPGSLQVATTEVGLPGVMLPNDRLIDLAGLHETYFAKFGFSARRLFTHYNPDWIYMPYPAYRDMIADIRADPAFRHYLFLDPKQTGSYLGVAINRRSPRFPELMRVGNLQR